MAALLPAKILFAEKIPAAIATPEPLFSVPTYATQAKIVASRGRTVNTGTVYLGQRVIVDSTLNIALANGSGAAGLTAAPSSVDRTLDTPTARQVEAATVIGTITSGTRQVETATAAGTISSGTAQVETATAAGTITQSGNLSVVVTGALVVDSPREIKVPVVAGDTAATWAGKVRTALGVAAITTRYTVGGSTTAISLTANQAAANDATLNISLRNGTCLGVTEAPTSANTTAGVTPGTVAVTVTSAILTGSPLTLQVAVSKNDAAATWAAKVRAALAANAAVAAKYTVGGSTTAIALTAIDAVANDGTLNIALANGTSSGVTTAATSANTTAGVTSGQVDVIVTGNGISGSPLTVNVAVLKDDTAATVAGKIRTALLATAAVTALYNVGGSGAEVVLTRNEVIVNDTQKFPLAAGAELVLVAAEDEAINLADIVLDAVTQGDGVQIVYVKSNRT